MVAITQGDGGRRKRKGNERGSSSCMNSIMKYTPDVQKGSFFWDVVEMEYIMRLYLGLDSRTRNE